MILQLTEKMWQKLNRKEKKPNKKNFSSNNRKKENLIATKKLPLMHQYQDVQHKREKSRKRPKLHKWKLVRDQFLLKQNYKNYSKKNYRPTYLVL